MKRSIVLTVSLLLAVSVLAGTVYGLDFKRKSKEGPLTAIMDFENKTEWWGWRLGRAAADVLATELMKGTSLRMMEREKLDAIMKEKNLSASGLTTPDTYVKMGGMLGVKYIITGSVSSFGEKQIGGHGFGFGGKLKSYRSTIDVRIIDAETGEIVFADSAEGEKKGVKLSFRGVGGGEDFDEQAASKVLRESAQVMAQKIQAALE